MSTGRYRTVVFNTRHCPRIEITDGNYIPTVDMVPYNGIEPSHSFKCDITDDSIYGRFAYDKRKIRIGKEVAIDRLLKYLKRELEFQRQKIQDNIDIVNMHFI